MLRNYLLGLLPWQKYFSLEMQIAGHSSNKMEFVNRSTCSSLNGPFTQSVGVNASVSGAASMGHYCLLLGLFTQSISVSVSGNANAAKSMSTVPI